MVGGAIESRTFAQQMRTDGYGTDTGEAVEAAKA